MLTHNESENEAVFHDRLVKLSLRFGLAAAALLLASQPALAHVESMGGSAAADVASPEVATGAGSFENEPASSGSGHVEGSPASELAYRPFVDYLSVGDLADLKFFYAAGLIQSAVETDDLGASSPRFEGSSDAGELSVEPAEGNNQIAIERPQGSGGAMSRYIAWWILGK